MTASQTSTITCTSNPRYVSEPQTMIITENVSEVEERICK